jgi:arylsulfatase A-like enzyme
MGDLNDPAIPEPKNGRGAWGRQDWVNRSYMQREEQQPQAKTFAMGLQFIEQNHARDHWFLHIETFDPHEPYFVDDTYKRLYPYRFDPELPDWPDYRRVPAGSDALTEQFRYTNAALISMCDRYLGSVLDAMDRHDLWKDTLLIVCTDHGFLLGEHEWWGKCVMPFYNEIARTPFFIWDPRCARSNERRQALVQTVDWAPTLLEFFGIERPADMQGAALRDAVALDRPVRAAALFGVHGGHVNVTDGRHVYMRAPATAANGPLFNYTLMPTHMRRTFDVEEMRGLQELAPPFRFTKGCRTMKIPCPPGGWARRAHEFGTLLFDLAADPLQQHPVHDPAAEERIVRHLTRVMADTDAPAEQFDRLGLSRPSH